MSYQSIPDQSLSGVAFLRQDDQHNWNRLIWQQWRTNEKHKWKQTYSQLVKSRRDGATMHHTTPYSIYCFYHIVQRCSFQSWPCRKLEKTTCAQWQSNYRNHYKQALVWLNRKLISCTCQHTNLIVCHDFVSQPENTTYLLFSSLSKISKKGGTKK